MAHFIKLKVGIEGMVSKPLPQVNNQNWEKIKPKILQKCEAIHILKGEIKRRKRKSVFILGVNEHFTWVTYG